MHACKLILLYYINKTKKNSQHEWQAVHTQYTTNTYYAI